MGRVFRDAIDRVVDSSDWRLGWKEVSVCCLAVCGLWDFRRASPGLAVDLISIEFADLDYALCLP